MLKNDAILKEFIKISDELAQQGIKKAQKAREEIAKVLEERRKQAKKQAKIDEKQALQHSKETENIDGSNNKKYSEREEYSDEFRRIQEESKRVSNEEVQLYHRAGKAIDSTLRRRLSTIFKRQLEPSNYGISDDSRILKNTGNFKVIKNIDGTLFRDIFEIIHKYLPNGELVDLHDVITRNGEIGYEDCTCYLSDDGLSGFAITDDGDLISVYNLSEKRGWLRSISNEIKSKVKTLDCFMSPIQNL